MTMKKFELPGILGIVLILVVACVPSTGASLQPTETIQPHPTAIVPSITLEPATLVLSKKGHFVVGTRKLNFHDAKRNERYVGITLWYPAVKPDTETGTGPFFEAKADKSGAPYALILSSTKVAELLAPYLVSHGFFWASVDRIDSYAHMNEEMINQPLDILFTLDQVASNPPEELEGMIDSEHVGVTGYSFDGYNTWALSGARIDPAYYLAQCPNPDPITKEILSPLSAFDCSPASAWDEYAAHAGNAITTNEDGMWLPMTDERIRAVIPMAGEGWWLFGERGLAAVDRPVLVLVGTQDELYPENVLIYDQVGTADKTMISFIGDGHMVMVYDPEHIAQIAHFVTAFFGFHLQGREEYARYFSQEFISQFDHFAWGVYEE
jgi:predicted dienelactone hydrolase